jgi:predicted nucleotidyltransferase
MDDGEVQHDIRLFSRENGPSEEEVRAVAEKILHRFDRVLLAYLFGSFLVRDSYQDIDIAIFLSGPMDPDVLFDLQMGIAGEIEGGLTPRVPCDVRILNGSPVEFQYEVIKTGTVLFSRSLEQKVEYETDITLRYLDLAYLFDRVDRAYLAGVGY